MTLGAAGVIAVAYFFAAQLGLALISQPSGAAVFWPASGLAVGFLIISGRRAYPALVIGLVIGTIAANLLSDRSLLTATFMGLCSAGEAILAAWLLELWFGRPFTMGDLRAIAGLLTAAGLATAASATGAAVTMTLLHSTAPYWDVWRTWFLSDGVGIVVAAPLVIGLDQLWRVPPSRRELIEGVGVLALLSLVRLYVMHHPSDWFSFNPAIVVLPPLVWLVIRCPPVFAIAGAFVVSILIFYETTYGIGRYGDAAVVIMERVKGAQAIVATGTIFILVLVALFAERRRSEAELKQSNNRLQLALDCAELGTWSLHLNTGRFENDVRDRRIHGHGKEAPPRTLAEMRSQVHPDDLAKLDVAFGELGHASGSCRTEYRLAPRTDQERAGRERWVTMEGTVVRRASGRPEQLLGVTRDITERKHAEDALRQSEVELGEAQRLAHIGSWYWEAEADVLVASNELFRIYGFDPATPPADFRREFGRRYSADDLKRLKAAARMAMRTGVGYELDLRAFRNGTPIWLTARTEVVRNGAGQIVGLRGTVQDITERKRAEEDRKILNAELDHRVKNALATVSAVVSHTGQGSRSVAEFAAAVEGRIHSMAATHELLSSRQWQGLSLTDLVRRELAPYATRNNTEINGPEVGLRAEAGQAMAMVLHELATNAAKYGAFSTEEGRVLIWWGRQMNGHPPRLVLEWQEIDGPPVVAPDKSSFGTSTIRDLIPYEFGGTVDLAFAPEGVRCRLELPADWLSNAGEPLPEARRERSPVTGDT